MCRFVAYLGAPLSPAQLVFGGSHSLYRQSWAPRELLSGSVNADGYGVVWYAEGRLARIAEARPIWYDPELRDTLAAVSSGCALAALRNGTDGLAVDRSSLPPLVHGGWSFILNGFVPDFRRAHMRALRSGLPDALYAELKGSSDSETLFLRTLASLEEGSSPTDALLRTAEAVRERVGDAEAQLNMALCDGERLWAVRTSSVHATNSLYVGTRTSLAPQGVVLASEIPDAPGGWEAVEPHSWIEIGPGEEMRRGRAK